MRPQLMHLRILLPTEVFVDKPGVLRVVAGTVGGSFGLLPQRLDCAAALIPGILTYETEAEGVAHVAIDKGVLLKTGPEVSISVRRAVSGVDLASLRDTVNHELRSANERERRLRTLVARMESGFVRRFLHFQHE